MNVLISSRLTSKLPRRASTAFALVCGLIGPASLSLAASAQSQVLPLSTGGHDRFYGVAFDTQGNSYAVGSFASSMSGVDSQILLAKFKPNGSIDTSFGRQGYVLQNVARAGDGEVARSVVVDAQGRILVGGSVEAQGGQLLDRDIVLLRFTADGQLDKSFGQQGIATFDLSTGVTSDSAFNADTFGGLALDKAGKIYVHGSQVREGGLDSDFVLFRVNTNGSMDKSFANQGRFTLDIDQLNASPKSLVVLEDGRVLGTGYQRRGSLVQPVVYRLTSTGQLDTSYGENGIFSQPVLDAVAEVYAAVPQGNSLVTVGYGKSAAQASLDFLSMRITESGVLDTSYGTSGGYTQIDVDGFNDNGRNLTVLPDGRFMLIGGGRYTSASSDGMITVLTAAGIPDSSFGENGSRLFDFGGAADFLWGIAVSPAGDSVMAVGLKGDNTVGDDAAIVKITL